MIRRFIALIAFFVITSMCWTCRETKQEQKRHQARERGQIRVDIPREVMLRQFNQREVFETSVKLVELRELSPRTHYDAQGHTTP